MNQWNTELRRTMGKLHYIERQKEEKEKEMQDEVEHFLMLKVLPAFSAFEEEVRAYGKEVTIEKGVDCVLLYVLYENEREFEVGVFVDPTPVEGPLPFFRTRHPGRILSTTNVHEYEYFCKEQERKTIADLSTEDLLQRLAHAYTQRMQGRLKQTLVDVKAFFL